MAKTTYLSLLGLFTPIPLGLAGLGANMMDKAILAGIFWGLALAATLFVGWFAWRFRSALRNPVPDSSHTISPRRYSRKDEQEITHYRRLIFQRYRVNGHIPDAKVIDFEAIAWWERAHGLTKPSEHTEKKDGSTT